MKTEEGKAVQSQLLALVWMSNRRENCYKVVILSMCGSFGASYKLQKTRSIAAPEYFHLKCFDYNVFKVCVTCQVLGTVKFKLACFIMILV